MIDLRTTALTLLQVTEPDLKAERVRAVAAAARPTGATAALVEPRGGIPGRPLRPALLPHTELKHRSVHSRDGHAALIHALAHIELNAIDLALDATWRFADQPERFYRDWFGVAQEEALHFQLLHAHLKSLGFCYGDFPAHDSLWQMAERTRADLLARIALVPRTLEARGLDASPPIRAKLAAIGDVRGAAIIDVILRDEIGHVALGNRWYRQFCEDRGLEPIQTFVDLAVQYDAPRQRGPFNLDARRAAGFDEAELAALQAGSVRPAAALTSAP